MISVKQKRIPYGKQYLDQSDKEAILNVLESDWLTQGPAVDAFERALCEVTGARYAVAVTNGTAALHLAAIASGCAPQETWITSPITFVASANAGLYVGANPAFIDIDPSTWVLEGAAFSQSLNSLKNPKVVVPVHLGGLPCEMEGIQVEAKKRKMIVIEDACHALGASYQDKKGQWKAVGSCEYSDMTVFSFHPVKHITTGEGGAITTNSPELAERLRLLRSHGITKNAEKMSANPGPWYYEMQDLGLNYRITDIQCALGISQLQKLGQFVERRRKIVEQYRSNLAGVEGIVFQTEPEGRKNSYHLCLARIDFARFKTTRAEVMKAMSARGVDTQVHYIPVYHQPYYNSRWPVNRSQFPQTELYYSQVLSLPLYPAMTDEDVAFVIETLRGVLGLK